jgi:CubicO group peptidase (beta-lactamase class C family)
MDPRRRSRLGVNASPAAPSGVLSRIGLLPALVAAACASPTQPARRPGLPETLPSPPLRMQRAFPPPQFADPQERSRNILEAMPEVEKLFDEQFAARKPPGMVVALVVDGEIRWSKGWGDRDVARHELADLDTVFRIASLTKSFTAMAVLQLRDAGKLSLDEPAEKYLPDLSQLAYPTRDSPRITIRQLLSHSAGLPEDNPWGDLQLGITADELQRIVARGLSFSHAPGTSYEYSNTGFALLGRLVERVSGQRLEEYVSQRVLQPLGMTASVWRREDVPAGRLALGYGHRASAAGPELAGGVREEPQLGDGAYAAMGGLYTSMRDLARYAAFQLDAWPPRDDADSGPLSRASRREMQQAARHVALLQVPGDPLRARATGYGFGLGAHESCDFDRIVSHTGGLPGFGAVLALLPERGIGFVGATNLTYTAPDAWTAAALLFKKGAIPQRETRAAVDLQTAQQAVSSLLEHWDAGLAETRFDRTAWYYESPAELKAHLDDLRSKLGSCRDGVLEPENPLRGTHKLACERGELDVYLTLTPEMPPLIQHLELKPIIPPGPRLQKAAERAVALTLRWNDEYAKQSFAPSLDAAGAKTQLTAHGPCQLGRPGPGDGAGRGTFRLTCTRDAQELEIALDDPTDRISELKMRAPRDPQQKCPRL